MSKKDSNTIARISLLTTATRVNSTTRKECSLPTSQLVAFQKALCFQVAVLNTFDQLAGASVAMHGASRAGRCNTCPVVPYPIGGLLHQSTCAKLPHAPILGRLEPWCTCRASGWGRSFTFLKHQHIISEACLLRKPLWSGVAVIQRCTSSLRSSPSEGRCC